MGRRSLLYPNGAKAVYNFNLDIAKNEFIVFVGPSGCGKSTTLRMIAGLEDITKGELYLNGEYSNYKPSKDRNVAIVFQSYALYSQMNVFENIAFPLTVNKYSYPVVDKKLAASRDVLKILMEISANNLKLALTEAVDKKNTNVEPEVYLAKKLDMTYQGAKELLSHDLLKSENISVRIEELKTLLEKNISNRLSEIATTGKSVNENSEYVDENGQTLYELRKLTKYEIQDRVFEAAEMLDLGSYLNRKPKELSGGQMQRVAVGRAIVKHAPIFLLDEPLSNLDARLRVTMRAEIVRLHKRINTTSIYVTHDQTEAMTMADRISFVEFCYSYYAEKQADYGLYVYVYNPQDVAFDMSTERNKIQLTYGDKTSYSKYTLEFLNYSTEAGYEGRFWKFKVSVCNLFDVLETYAQAYFIYVIESSLIVANYSIRTDNRLIDEGNFPIWLTDFFPRNYRRCSRHAHILDFDILRLGKKVLENNPNAGSFEFGVVAISEVGKERGNNLELKEVKKGKGEANQKNDLFNSWLKMCRHSATVDNFPFIKVFTDEQRPESWGADARDLCDIVNIVNSSEGKLALPFYTIEDMIAEVAFNKFINLYYDFRFRRGDNTLLVHILKSVTAWLWRRNIKVYNTYGYNVLKIEKERGTMDGKVDKKKYYIMNRKIYSRRFSTDCFSDYFNDMARQSKVGINDYREYVTERASVDELKAQNSYFINALYGNVPLHHGILNGETDD